ncbi:TPA: hypothetical protein P0E36_004881 [Vibrio harveyi]|nr:hypothetical protein [Vibrio harveyi]
MIRYIGGMTLAVVLISLSSFSADESTAPTMEQWKQLKAFYADCKQTHDYKLKSKAEQQDIRDYCANYAVTEVNNQSKEK